MNNSFTQCLDKICGLEISSLASYKYSVFGGNTVVVEGHKGLSHYGEQTVEFALSKGKLCVLGCQLKIKCLDKHFAVIVGEIKSVEVIK